MPEFTALELITYFITIAYSLVAYALCSYFHRNPSDDKPTEVVYVLGWPLFAFFLLIKFIIWFILKLLKELYKTIKKPISF